MKESEMLLRESSVKPRDALAWAGWWPDLQRVARRSSQSSFWWWTLSTCSRYIFCAIVFAARRHGGSIMGHTTTSEQLFGIYGMVTQLDGWRRSPHNWGFKNDRLIQQALIRAKTKRKLRNVIGRMHKVLNSFLANMSIQTLTSQHWALRTQHYFLEISAIRHPLAPLAVR